MSTRTQELQGRARERKSSGGGGTPFVRWADSYAWVEGKMVGSFDTKYGLAATIEVTNTGGSPLSALGKDEEGNDFTVKVEPGIRVNIGTGAALLSGTITKEDEGKSFHVAFEGWEKPKGKNQYRIFKVFDMSDREPAKAGAPSAWGGPDPEDTSDYSKSNDRDLPF
jgi:hypothetical protein